MKILYLPDCYSQQRQYQKKVKIYPVLMAMEAEWYRKQGNEVTWEYPRIYPDSDYNKIITEAEGLPFHDLPTPDRQFTRWWKYQDNGNFKYLPATYIQSARDCWWQQCTFCKWAKKYPAYAVRPVNDVIKEIEECVALGAREIFDDSGSFPTGAWLIRLLSKLKKSDLRISCNIRFGTNPPYKLMRLLGFRMLLYGLESANQETLDKFNKGFNVEQVIPELKIASQAGLEPHICVIFGAPWETDKDALRTLELVWYLLKKGYAKTAQASFYDSPDKQANENHRKYVGKIYDIWKSPKFWLNKLRDIHNKDDLKYLWKSVKAGIRDKG